MSIFFWIITGLITCEMLAAITGFISWKKMSRSYWKWFPVFLLIISLTEISAVYISYGLKNNTLNRDIYRYFGLPIQFLFFFWLFAQYFKPYKENKWPLFGVAIYFTCWIADIIYFSKLKFFFSSFSYTIGNIVLLVLIILFFIRFINSKEILNYRSSMMFWVCLGLLVFYLGTFPFYALRNTLYYGYKHIFYPYWYISFGLDYLMYILFILAFLWGKPK